MRWVSFWMRLSHSLSPDKQLLRKFLFLTIGALLLSMMSANKVIFNSLSEKRKSVAGRLREQTPPHTAPAYSLRAAVVGGFAVGVTEDTGRC